MNNHQDLVLKVRSKIAHLITQDEIGHIMKVGIISFSVMNGLGLENLDFLYDITIGAR